MIGQRVIELRQARGWGQSELAERAQVAQATISRIENGQRRNPGTETMRRIAQALNVTMDELTAAPVAA